MGVELERELGLELELEQDREMGVGGVVRVRLKVGSIPGVLEGGSGRGVLEVKRGGDGVELAVMLCRILGYR